MNRDKLVMVFVKNPKLGKVKTRLAKTIGAERAYHIYLKLLRHTMEEVSLSDAEKQVWYSDFLDMNDIFAAKKFQKKVQSTGDLGVKMMNAFQEAFREGYKRVVIIGSDCPGITSGLLEHAFETLKTCDVVIGPSEDGGYYLLGMKAYYPELFKGIEWSTQTVLEETLKIAASKKLSVEQLPVLNDVDTEEDLNSGNYTWLL